MSWLILGVAWGRVVCLAAQMPMKEVIGIEADPEIARRCAANIAKLRRVKAQSVSILPCFADSQEAELVWQRASALYLFAPFGAQTFMRVLAAIETNARGAIRLAYVNLNAESEALFSRWQKQKSWIAGGHPTSLWTLKGP